MNDFYKPVYGNTFCAMLQTHTEHLWTNDPAKGFRAPKYYVHHFGGSEQDWPKKNVDGDERTYLGFWGEAGNRRFLGGCCSESNAPSGGWGKKFTMYYSVVPIETTTATTATTTTATTSTNTALKALHDRLEDLENGGVSDDVKVIVDSVKTLETTLESQAETIVSQAEQIVSLKKNVVRSVTSSNHAHQRSSKKNHLR